ncbi:hypothetical protein [Streptomyces sp. NPDC048636]|uniref:hypothetical protein n=1 Tax=Streptomyces sp. NPDC048636 TaxID=3155762 RepID=UPI003424D222
MRRVMRAVALGASAFCAVAFGGAGVAQAQSGPSGEALLASALGGTIQKNDCGTQYGGVDLEAAVAGATGDTNVGAKCSNLRFRGSSSPTQGRTGMSRPGMPTQGRAALPQGMSMPQGVSMPQGATMPQGTAAPQSGATMPQGITMPTQNQQKVMEQG